MASKVPGPGVKKPVGKVAPPKPRAAKVAVPFNDVKTPEAPAIPPLPVVDPVPAVAAVAEQVTSTADVVADRVTETVEQAASAAAETTAETIEQTAPQAAETAVQGKDIMETTIEKTQAFFGDFNERAKSQVEKNTKLVAEATEFAKGNVEALVESGKIAARGFETLSQDAADYSRRSFETATATLKSMSAIKSPADFFKLQSDYVRSSFDSIVAETSKNTEAMIKLAGDAAQPISNRFAVAIEKVKTAA